MSQLRIMPVYVEDVLSDAIMTTLDAECFGAYWRLLFYAWKEDGLPADERTLRLLARVDARRWPAVWKAVSAKFVMSEATGKWINVKQERTRERVCSNVEKARKAAETRWSKRADALPMQYNPEPGTRNPEPLLRHLPTGDDGRPSVVPRKQEELKLEEEPTPPVDTDLPQGEATYTVFEHWRKAYPEHKNAARAGERMNAIKRAIKARRDSRSCSRRAAVAEICRAIDAAKVDPFCCGENKTSERITELTSILSIAVLERLCRARSTGFVPFYEDLA